MSDEGHANAPREGITVVLWLIALAVGGFAGYWLADLLSDSTGFSYLYEDIMRWFAALGGMIVAGFVIWPVIKRISGVDRPPSHS